MTNGASILATLGLDRSSWQTSLARAETESKTFARSVTGAFSSIGAGLSATAITAFFSSIIEKAHEIHHEAERFGIDAQQLQMIGNAAQEEGVQLESVARAMSQLVFAEASAAGGNQKMIDAFATLRINLETFKALNPEQKMLALADAVRAAGLNTDTYNAAAELLGKRFGTELIPVLLKGGNAIQNISKQMGILNSETVTRLNTAYETWKTFWSQIVVTSSDALSTSIDMIKLLGVTAKGIFNEIKDSGVGMWRILERAAHFDFKGAESEWQKGWEQMKKDAEQSAKDISSIGKKIGHDYAQIGRDFSAVITGTAAAAGATGGPAAANAGMWDASASPGGKAAGSGFGFGTIEGREAERIGEFGDEKRGIKGSRDIERDAAFNERWAGGGLTQGRDSGSDKLKSAFQPTEQKLDKLITNTNHLDFENK